MHSITKLTILQQAPYKRKEFRPCSVGKPMQFQKSDYRLPLNVAAAEMKGPPHPVDRNLINFGHCSNAKKDTNRYQTVGQPNAERAQLDTEGKYILCKNHDHMARDCITRKVSYSNQPVYRKLMDKVKTAS